MVCLSLLTIEPSVIVLRPAGTVRHGKGHPVSLGVKVFLGTESSFLRLCIHGLKGVEGATLLPCPLHEAARCLLQGSLIDPGCFRALADFPFGALIEQELAALGHIP